MNHLNEAFLLASLAGCATILGSILALVCPNISRRWIAFLFAFCAGVMLYGALLEIFPKGRTILEEMFPAPQAMGLCILAFFVGVLSLFLLSVLLPEGNDATRTATLVALSLMLHNFPEGLSTFTAALGARNIAYPMVFAVALHNVPEGLIVSLPLMAAGKSPKQAFLLSALSGLAEPLGALLGLILLQHTQNEVWMAILFCFCAGLMTYLSLFELFADALENVSFAIPGFVSGMGTMAASLLLFTLF